jgi:two-component system, NarL family, sensor histidine kinase DesK
MGTVIEQADPAPVGPAAAPRWLPWRGRRGGGGVADGGPAGAGDRFRRLALVGFSLIYAASPLSDLLRSGAGPARRTLMTAGLLAVIVLFARQNLVSDEVIGDDPVPWAEIGALAALATALAVAGGGSWVLLLSFVTAVVALRCPPGVVAAALAGCAVLCAARLAVSGVDPGAVALVSLVPVVIGGFSFSARGRIALSNQLRATQHELARAAVTEERLRIARDLHDLLGHSLSLIAVKAELARRVLDTDPRRAGQEIGDVEAVARRALGEVRHAVANYRRPTLAAELASARQALTAAGIACVVDTPPSWRLPDDVDALLAWTVREGCTNVIRHSHARHCTLRLAVDPPTATVEVRDDGVGGGGGAGRRAGNGLAGLSERATRLGARVQAAPGGGAGDGFLLRVEVPV